MALPFVLLVITEVLLRAFGYGNNLQLFVADKDHPDCLVLNPAVSQRYFTQQANAPVGNQEPFKLIKPAGTKRLFVLGESTTLGFPYMHNGSFSRMLKYRLMLLYPQTNFEVINLSLTAVNSHTVRDMATEVVKYSPDAVLIYTGHNEYYGALGVASTSNLGSSPVFVSSLIALRQYRLVQLLFNTYNKITGGNRVDTGKNLMERMVAKPGIPQGSSLYSAGVNQFANNMNAVCKVLAKNHIPVLISTLVSNQRSLPPLDENNCTGAGKATAIYKQATLAYQQEKYALAKKYYIAAREEDMLRFRAPLAINAQIKAFARSYSNIYLVDAERLFEQASAHGIVDSATLLEHVHPNLKGYALLADAFFNALNHSGLLPEKPLKNMAPHQIQAGLPLTRVDSVFGEYSVMLLKQRWPFHGVAKDLPVSQSKEQQLAYDMLKNGMPWNSAMDQLMLYYQQQRDTLNALKVAEAVMLEYPYDASFYLMAGRIAGLKNYDKAANYLQRAFGMAPSLEIAKELYDLHMRNDHPELAVTFVLYGLQQAPQNASLANVERLIARLIKLKQQLTAHKNNTLQQQVGQSYTDLGYTALAQRYYKTLN